MGDEVFALQVSQGVLEFHQLDEQVVLGIEPRSSHGRLEVKAQPLLYSQAAQLRTALGQVQEQHQIQHERGCQNRVAAKEIHFDLHGISQPSEDIDVIPTLFVISTRRVVVDADFVGELSVQFRVEFGLQNVLQHRQL